MKPGSYVITGPEADAFRAVAVAHLDLRIARDMIEKCIEEGDGSDSSREEHEAYWTTALIRYCRAFDGSGGRSWDHRGVISQLPDHHQRRSRRLRMLRDKLFAHPVGVGEDMAVTVVLGPDRIMACRVYGGAVRMTRVTSPGTDEAKAFAELLDLLLPIVKRMEDEQHRKFLTVISAWPVERLLAGGLYEKQINFDDTSRLYRSSLRKYK